MKKIAYQLLLDFYKKNLKTLSKEVIYFARRLSIICDNSNDVVKELTEIEKLENCINTFEKCLYSKYCNFVEESNLRTQKNKQSNEKNSKNRDNSNDGDYSDVTRLADLLRRSLTEILKDVIKDRNDLEGLSVPDFDISDNNNNVIIKKHIEEFKFFSFSICYFHNRSELYLSRLNELKARLAQSMDIHSNSILRSEPNRKIQENVTDSYVTLLSTRTYRDLHNFLCKFNDSYYPYKNIPSLYQHQHSSNTSKILSFSTDENYRNWVYSLVGESEISNSGSNNSFATLQLSYWLQERNLMPVIGHEVAHRVLRNIGSRNLIPQVLSLEARAGNLGHFVREISAIIRTIALKNNINYPQKIELELVCDLLGATRFGYSYLYTWFLIGFNTYAYSNHIVDEFGRYEKLMIASSVKRNIYDPTFDVLQRYILGKSLLYWLKVMRTEFDASAVELADAIDEHLELLIISTYSKEKVAIALEIVKSIRSQIRAWNNKVPLSGLRDGFDSPGSEKDYWMYIQSISKECLDKLCTPFLKDLDSRIAVVCNSIKKGKEGYSNHRHYYRSDDNAPEAESYTIKALSDLPWRVMWKLSYYQVVHKIENQSNKSTTGKSIEDLNNTLRKFYIESKAITRILIDDYVYSNRTILADVYFEALKLGVNFKKTLNEKFREQLEIFCNAKKAPFNDLGSITEAITRKLNSDLECSLDPSATNNAFCVRATDLTVDYPITNIKILRILISRTLESLEIESKFADDENFRKLKKNTLLTIDRHLKHLSGQVKEQRFWTELIHEPIVPECPGNEFGVAPNNDLAVSSLIDNYFVIDLGKIKLNINNEVKLENENRVNKNGEGLCFSGNLIGNYDYFDVVKDSDLHDVNSSNMKCVMNKKKDWLMETTSRNALLLHNNLKYFDHIDLVVKVFLFKADQRLVFLEEVKRELKKNVNFRSLLFLSFGTEDAFLMFSFGSEKNNKEYTASIKNCMDYLVGIYDKPVVSRTERIFTQSFLSRLTKPQGNMNEERSYAPAHLFKASINVTLTHRPATKLSTILEKISDLPEESLDIYQSNGEVDISIPIELINEGASDSKGIIEKFVEKVQHCSELKFAIQRLSTELRYKELKPTNHFFDGSEENSTKPSSVPPNREMMDDAAYFEQKLQGTGQEEEN